MSGFFVSLDGIDGCGKSTQCQLLSEWFFQQDYSIVPCADPGSTSLGYELRKILLNWKSDMSPRCEALLFMASRAQLVDQVIRPALDEGAIVISDRFLLANVAYQAYAGNLPPDELWQVGLWGTSNIQPDLTIVLDITPDSAQKRRLGPADRMEQREVQYHHRVRQGFLLEAERKPDRIRVLDANRSVEDVHQDICQEVGRALESRQRT